MSKTTFPVNGGAMPATIITNVNFTDFGQLNRDTALVCHGVLRTSANGKPRHPRAALLSKIMIEAHARAKADYANELSCRARAHHVIRKNVEEFKSLEAWEVAVLAKANSFFK
ncbi:hypothetical protein [Bradyrhizobium sp. USDA 3650]